MQLKVHRRDNRKRDERHTQREQAPAKIMACIVPLSKNQDRTRELLTPAEDCRGEIREGPIDRRLRRGQ